MNLMGKLGLASYGIALAGSLIGALMLFTGFLLGADWNYGVHRLMVAYFVLSALGTIGLITATLTFISERPIFTRVSLVSNIETLLFASVLALGFLFDSHRDYTRMIVGVSRSASISISSIAWFVIPVVTSAIGTYAAFL
jgi:hypothetical protein